MKTEYRRAAREKERRTHTDAFDYSDSNGIDQLIDLAVKSSPAEPPAARQDGMNHGSASNSYSSAMEPRP